MPTADAAPLSRRPWWRGAVAAVVIGGLGAAAWHHLQVRVPEQARQARGAALYRGEVPLPGRLARHGDDLPALATRCINCHETASPAPGAAAPASQPYAQRLDRAGLTEVRPRRGGPPSRYDAARLCALLRTGIDPAGVLIMATMPRYEATDAQCADLWSFLVAR